MYCVMWLLALNVLIILVTSIIYVCISSGYLLMQYNYYIGLSSCCQRSSSINNTTLTLAGRLSPQSSSTTNSPPGTSTGIPINTTTLRNSNNSKEKLQPNNISYQYNSITNNNNMTTNTNASTGASTTTNAIHITENLSNISNSMNGSTILCEYMPYESCAENFRIIQIHPG